MMTKKQFEELMKALKGIESRLDVLIGLYRTSMPTPKVTDEEEKILKLCDRKHTIADMVKETGKKSSNVRRILTFLRRKGLILSVRTEGKVVFERT